MSIYKTHLTYSDFINNEVKTLGQIQGNSTIESYFPDLSYQAEIFFNLYKDKGKSTGKKKKSKQRDHEFLFSSELILEIEKSKRRIIVEALLRPNFSESTYQLIILNNENIDSTLLRKFHFDYAPNVNPANKQPVYHLQYGGKATPTMKNHKIDDSNIFYWLSQPRIFTYPMNLALFLDFIFCEFPNEETKKISETNEWRQLIKSNEDLLTKNYYQNINNFFSRNHKSTYLFRDFYYGKQ